MATTEVRINENGGGLVRPEDAGRFGCDLTVGQEVEYWRTTEDGDAQPATGRIARIYSAICTGNPGSGAPNYVLCDVTPE